MQKAIYGEGIFDYLLYLPKNYDKNKKYPLLIFLHGAGERGDDLSVLKRHSLPLVFDGDVDYEAIAISPQCKEGKTWNSQPEKVIDFIKEMVQRYNADEDAVSITGISMGGYGTWQLIMDYPTVFAAAAPICGGGLAWRAETVKNLPLRIYHGEEDSVVNVFYSKDIYRKLQECGSTKAQLFLYPGVGHDVWNQVFHETDVIDWLISKRRNL